MDVLHLVKKDHKEILELLFSLKESNRKTQKKVVFTTLQSKLKLFTLVERDYLYPEALNLLKDGAHWVKMSLLSHIAIIRSVDALSKCFKTPGNNLVEIDTNTDALISIMVKHVESAEEFFIFKIRQTLSTEDREDLGQVILDFKSDYQDSTMISPTVLRRDIRELEQHSFA